MSQFSAQTVLLIWSWGSEYMKFRYFPQHHLHTSHPSIFLKKHLLKIFCIVTGCYEMPCWQVSALTHNTVLEPSPLIFGILCFFFEAPMTHTFWLNNLRLFKEIPRGEMKQILYVSSKLSFLLLFSYKIKVSTKNSKSFHVSQNGTPESMYRQTQTSSFFESFTGKKLFSGQQVDAY